MSSSTNETILFNSSLISKYEGVERRVLFDVKIVKCGDYIHVYQFSNTRSKVNKRDEDKKINIKKIDTDNLTKVSSSDRVENAWVSNVRKLKKDFKYIAVPEFQKRGAVHYHVLSNLGREDTNIIYLQKERVGKAKDLTTIYDVKYWTKGFARVDFIKSDYKKIYGYICKYMTKDIDNKLFGKHRYFNSQNLVKPQTEYLDLTKKEDYDYFMKLTNNKSVEYTSDYKDIYTDSNITFYELL